MKRLAAILVAQILVSGIAIRSEASHTAGWHHATVSALPCGRLCPGRHEVLQNVGQHAEALGSYDPCASPYQGFPNFYDEISVTAPIPAILDLVIDDIWDLWVCDTRGRTLTSTLDDECYFLISIPCLESSTGIKVSAGQTVILRVFNVLGSPETQVRWRLTDCRRLGC